MFIPGEAQRGLPETTDNHDAQFRGFRLEGFCFVCVHESRVKFGVVGQYYLVYELYKKLFKLKWGHWIDSRLDLADVRLQTFIM